jgi:hypothetical protein
MDRAEILELIDSATLQAIKTLTTKSALVKTKYFVIENVPNGFSIQKIISFIRLNGNLNFIFFVHKKLMDDANNSCSWIIGCRNSSEFNQFIWKFKEITIDGCKMKINPANKNLEARYAAFLDRPTNLPYKLLKMKASVAYNNFFPSERLMELLLECETYNILDSIDGFMLVYKHATRKLTEDIFLSFKDQQETRNLQNTLESMGNRDILTNVGGLFLVDKSIWARQLSHTRADADVMVNTINPQLIEKNIITNGLDINNIRNLLL